MKADIFQTKNMILGETRRRGIVITSTDKSPLFVTDASCVIHQKDGTQLGTASVIILDNNTAAVKIYADITATKAGEQYAEITADVSGMRVKARLVYDVIA